MKASTERTTPGRRQSGLFAHPEDKHCAVFHGVVVLCYATAFWLYLHPNATGLDGPWQRAAFVVAAAFLLGWISGINVGVNFHNHAHKPIFRSRRIGLWFERFWTVTGGWPAFYWAHSHVTVHHQNLLGERDWTMPRRRPDGRFENIYRYVFCHWPWRFLPHLARDFFGREAPNWMRRKAAKEGLYFLVLWSVPFWIDPGMALCLWVLPHWIANGVIMGSGMYVQHAGCQPKSDAVPFRHSNAFTSRFFNLTMFNIGYHVCHHDYDQVHWSALPRFHERMKRRHVERGVHVVPYGYFHAAHLCSTPGRTEIGFQRFVNDQARGYEPAPGTAIPGPSQQPRPARQASSPPTPVAP